MYAGLTAERIVTAVDVLERFPRRGRQVPEANDSAIRELIVEPYRVMYRALADVVEILAVVHGARSVPKMKPRPWRKPRPR